MISYVRTDLGFKQRTKGSGWLQRARSHEEWRASLSARETVMSLIIGR
jgi:hypothetical protein